VELLHIQVFSKTFTETGLPKYCRWYEVLVNQLYLSGMNETQRQVLRVFDRLQVFGKSINSKSNICT